MDGRERVAEFGRELREGPEPSDRSIKEIIDALRPQLEELARRGVPIDGVARAARDLLDELQHSLHAESLADREAHTYPVDDLDGFRERVGGGGFFRLAWCGSPACETALGEGTGATIRVILDGQAPDGPCLVDGAAATHTVLAGRAY